MIPKKLITKATLKAQIKATMVPNQPPNNQSCNSVGSCGHCGQEMAYNIPRLGISSGFIHKESREYQCERPKPKAKAPRTLKFRVWDHLTKTWNYFDIRSTFGRIPNDIPHSQIQQFTWFLDKHEKEVYEGDILEFFGLKGVATFFSDRGGCFFGFLSLKDQIITCPLHNPQDYKVIGNIFDGSNPNNTNKPKGV